MNPGKFRECKQCFRVVTATNFRRHLSSHDHQVKACVFDMGRQSLAKCSTCKNTNIAHIRAQCTKCCQTLAKMYDAILKPLNIYNRKRGASSSAPQKLKVSKQDSKSLSQAYKVLASKMSSPSKLSLLSSKTFHNYKQRSSLSYGDLLLEKSKRFSDASASYKSSKTSNTIHQHFPNASNDQSLKKSGTLSSKPSSMAKKTPNVNLKSSQRISENCLYKTSSHKSSASKKSTRNTNTSSFHQQQFSQSSRGSCGNAFKMSESTVCSMPDKPVLWDENSYPQSSDKAFEEKHKIAQSIDSMTVTNYPSVRQTTSECTTISVQVVEQNPDVSEYIFKFCKFSPSDNPQKNNAPSSSVVQPDNNINESVTRLDPFTTTQKNLRDSKDLFSCQQELIDLPDLYSEVPTRPFSPMTTSYSLVTTLSNGNESVDTTVYDDWFLATDLDDPTDCYNPIEDVNTQNEAIINKHQIKCRDISSLL